MPSEALIRPGEALEAAARVPGAKEAIGSRLDVEAALERRDSLAAMDEIQVLRFRVAFSMSRIILIPIARTVVHRNPEGSTTPPWSATSGDRAVHTRIADSRNLQDIVILGYESLHNTCATLVDDPGYTENLRAASFCESDGFDIIGIDLAAGSGVGVVWRARSWEPQRR
ncbi:MAG: hypothetical protein ACFCU2_12330 [Acidimicrobiia bacterium]